MKRSIVGVVALTLALPLAVRGVAQTPGLTIAAYAQAAKLQVSSPAFTDQSAIPRPYSAYGENFSPALAWQGAPGATRAFVVIMEDPDAKAPAPSPFVHWTIFNLPAEQTSLHESIPAHPRLPAMGNAQQGKNSRGTVGYFGPRPPTGDAAHHYHFEVFALDAKLALPPGASSQQIAAAMSGHVVAAGEIVGLFAPQW